MRLHTQHPRRGMTAAWLVMGIATVGAWAGVVLDDPLAGSTTGTRVGGQFVAGGWQATNQYDAIYWHVPVLTRGAFEYDVKGLGDACSGGLGEKNELSHMYDWTYNNADTSYSPGYRESPHKQFIRKQCYSPKARTLEILWQIIPNYLEDDTPPLAWDAGATYRFRSEWEPVGGNSVIRTYRNGGLIWTQTVAGVWNPGGLSVRIAASTRRADEGAPVGAIYGNVKVYDSSGPPGAPTIAVPADGETINTSVAFIQWTGDAHSRYRVRVCTQNDPDVGIAWDSFDVSSDRSFCYSGDLASSATYYAFVRLGNAAEWGPWNGTGRRFMVDTGYSPPGADLVQVAGTAVRDKQGPFLGLGATYMQAMRRCKYDRNRFLSDLAFLASRDFNCAS